MTLSAGETLGPYEILALIGVGGMGEVYQARDTRLARQVAIKLLPPELAGRADRRARFETEARAISSLNHPHICTLFDIGEQDGHTYLVMELLEGVTLDDRLADGPLPHHEVLRYGAQIAAALDHAHREGVVHRDLKPGNVMLTPSGAKLLDFGLAQGPVPASLAPGETLSFAQHKLTAQGTLIGTFHYMAPEQLEGKPVDPRTDIFSFGTLLYEMATGRKAFDGNSQASLIASILTEQPPPIRSTRVEGDHELSVLDHIVQRCLAKDPDARWQQAKDVEFELNWILEGGAQRTMLSAGRRPSRREGAGWVLAAAIATIAVGAALATRPAPTGPTTRFVVAPPPGATIGVAENRPRLAISPDGRHLAFVATVNGRQQIWVRSLDAVAARPIEGTDGGLSPFWSPDSRFIGFFSPGEGTLKKVDASGGPSRTISAADSDGAPTWGRDGTILFTQFREGIYRVSADGGTPVAVTRVNRTAGEMNHYWPAFLPDGRHFLFMATARDTRGFRTPPTNYVASLDSPAVTPLARMHSAMVYAPPGFLLFIHEGALLAQPFDATALRLRGEPLRIAEDLAYYRTLGTAGFTVSENGVLAYHGNSQPQQIAWFDRRGITSAAGWPTQNYDSLRIAPDAQRVVVGVTDGRLGTSDIWLHDLHGGAPVRVTSDLSNENQPLWSPDGSRIVFRSDGLGAPSLYMKTMETGAEEQLVGGPVPVAAEDWSIDGNWIVYSGSTRQTGTDLWLLPMRGDRKPTPWLNTRFEEWDARFAPDSAWMAFVSNESGRPEVYVASVHRPGEKRAVSTDGGSAPRWRRDGRELYYVSADRRSIMAVPIQTGAALQAGPPVRLFSIPLERGARARAGDVVYDVSADGQRFLVAVPSGEPSSSAITVTLNWASTLKP